jgi:hypothetical protein
LITELKQQNLDAELAYHLYFEGYPEQGSLYWILESSIDECLKVPWDQVSDLLSMFTTAIKYIIDAKDPQQDIWNATSAEWIDSDTRTE